MWPDLNTFRRAVVPVFERNESKWFGRDIMFSKLGQRGSYVGVIKERSVQDIVSELQSMDNVYSRNLAALKWRPTRDGERAYERASYAYVPEGFFGKYQYHVRLWPHEQGTAVWAHYELNPWHSPSRHYNGEEWDPEAGASWVRSKFEIDTTADILGVVKR